MKSTEKSLSIGGELDFKRHNEGSSGDSVDGYMDYEGGEWVLWDEFDNGGD